jgi:hypothetical protein
MDFESKAGGVKYFFEITGRAGRIYLDGFSFGDGFELQIEGSVSAMPRSPVKMYPETGAPFNPLHKILDEYYQNKDAPPRYDAAQRRYHDAGQLPQCSIGAEFKENQKVQRRTLYRFFQCRVIKLYRPKLQYSRLYVIEFRSAARA